MKKKEVFAHFGSSSGNKGFSIKKIESKQIFGRCYEKKFTTFIRFLNEVKHIKEASVLAGIDYSTGLRYAKIFMAHSEKKGLPQIYKWNTYERKARNKNKIDYSPNKEIKNNICEYTIRGNKIIIDVEAIPLFESHNWVFIKARQKTIKFYIAFIENNTTNYLHRLIMKAKKNEIIDHINGNALDCRESNLQYTTHSLNRLNSKGRKRKLPKGVYQRRGSFYSKIGINGKVFWLGKFDTIEDAKDAYLQKLQEIIDDIEGYLTEPFIVKPTIQELEFRNKTKNKINPTWWKSFEEFKAATDLTNEKLSEIDKIILKQKQPYQFQKYAL